MSMADCPHFPECGHRSESCCDATGPNDERQPIQKEPMNKDEIQIISCCFSGKPTSYSYTATAAQLVNRSPGDRVIVPNKLNDDGSISLTIATFEGVSDVTDAARETLKPIVQFIDGTAMREAQLTCLLRAAKQGSLSLGQMGVMETVKAVSK